MMNRVSQGPLPDFGAALRSRRAIQAYSACGVVAAAPDELAIAPQPFDLGVLMARLHNQLGPRARAKGLTLRIDGQANLLGRVWVDARHLEGVLVHLLGNAIEFTDQGEVRLQLQTLMISPAVARLRFEVSDTGPGLSPEVLAGLLDPDPATAPRWRHRHDSPDQGLALTRHRVAAMGGTLGAVSQPGRGTTFGFELTLSRALATGPAPRRADPSPTPAPPLPGPRLAGLRVLVVDDSNITREVIAQALEVEGAESTLATDGQEAIDRLKASPAGFDALLMDLQMPVLDGLAATRLIRGELGLTHLPIIALTAGVLPRQLEEARRAGITEMLAKPVKRERLAEVLRQWVPAKSLPPGARPPHLAMAPSGAGAPGQPRPALDPALDPASRFPLIAGIDRERAQEIFCGNRSLFLQFIEDFAARSGGLVAEIRRELARGDRDDAARRLHALRGNAGGIGALAVMRAASHLEAALVEGDTAWEPGLRLLDSQLAALIAAITAAGRQAPGPGRQPHP